MRIRKVSELSVSLQSRQNYCIKTIGVSINIVLVS